MKIGEVTIFGYPAPVWIGAAVVFALLALVAWVVWSIPNDPELRRILSTPVTDFTMGHVLALMFIAWLLWR